MKKRKNLIGKKKNYKQIIKKINTDTTNTDNTKTEDTTNTEDTNIDTTNTEDTNNTNTDNTDNTNTEDTNNINTEDTDTTNTEDTNNINTEDTDTTNTKNNEIEYVIARYNENVNFLLKNKFINRSIYLYNKGPDIKNPKILNAKNIKIIKLPNVGKCDHTYLYHIIKNYNNLANLTVFLPASYYYMDIKRRVGDKIINNSIKNNKSYFSVSKLNQSNYTKLYNFKMNHYKTSFKPNLVLKEKNKNYDIVHSNIRPYGRWFESIFDINEPNNRTIYNCKYIIYRGMFSVKRDALKKHNIHIYKKLISYVNKDINPEAGHYIERVWATLFYPFGHKNMI